MFGFMKKNTAASANTSPAHSEADSGLKPNRRTSSEPILISPELDKENKGRQYTPPSKAVKSKYDNGFSDSGGLESQSVQELENYAAYKALMRSWYKISIFTQMPP